MIIWIFIILMLIFCITDIKYFHISNWIVLPAILLGLYFTNFWWQTLITGGIGAMFFYQETICPYCGKVAEVIKTPLSCFAGGDVKLMLMASAFLGYKAIGIFIVSRLLVWIYKKVIRPSGGIAYAPFFTMACLPFLWIR